MGDSNQMIFIVDDDQDIRTSLTRALTQRGFEVEAFASGREFLAAYDGEQAACLVLDHGMPGMSGLELQALLNGQGSPLAVVFITGHGGVPESVQAMKAGAVDFLEKPFRQSVLIERIETALEIASAKRDALETRRALQARFNRLTAREEEIVKRMLTNPAEVSSKEIANSLGISPRTVDHHRARILEKLEIRSLVELVDLVSKLRGESASAQL
ncbi:response regulator transcription factor [Salipiger bermudensis]|uniref:Two-component response regulator n=1 Tax=Salipiger bermudensis (strain DSM 26914 / JCM 13377 / KCTC 12554 / HTCC2601) TaxID=314265 RepID=Q0FLQ7_SALBH|nr:response regulator [Salipiger bermudensis]MBR9892359.1 response regulator transcription factor [bacterium]EAU45177.1 two-component response regulator [Salipiger bermudensis HTCC2601]MBN9677946.1 response regulator transcription factor [Salipiger bermudensis]MCA1285516.1 response regulator [Salipiger bermudensis]MCP4594054.1 response regulator transcription factor [bacterium]